MSEYRKIPTSPEVWAVIRARHPDLKVFSTFSAPDGNWFGDPDECAMFTEYGFGKSDVPIIGAETTWEKEQDKPHNRLNEKTIYWLCIHVED